MYDLDKMPMCKFGSVCPDKECSFKHKRDEEKEECINYRLGFCSFGPLCEFRHVRRPAEELLAISELWKPNSFVEQRARAESAKAGGAYRINLCKYFLDLGWCPLFEQCKFAHSPGEAKRYLQLAVDVTKGAFQPHGLHASQMQQQAIPGAGGFTGRKRPRPEDMGGPGGQGGPGGFAPRAPGAVGRGGPLPMQQRGGPGGTGAPVAAGFGTAPDAPDTATLMRQFETEEGTLRSQGMPDLSVAGTAGSRTNALTLVVRSLTSDNLKQSLKRSEWVTSPAGAATVEDALREAGGAGVFLVFSVVGSKHYQGVARVRAAPRAWEGTAATGLTVVRAAGGGAEGEGGKALSPQDVRVIPIEWLRTCILPFTRTRNVRNPDTNFLPVAVNDRDWLRLPSDVGKALLMLVFQAPYVRVPLDDPALAKQPFELMDSNDPALREKLLREDRGADIAAACKAIVPHSESGGRNTPNAAPGASLPSLWLCERTITASSKPASQLIHLLLNGMPLPPGTQGQAYIAAETALEGQRGAFMLALPGAHVPTCIARGVFPMFDSIGHNDIVYGTPILIFDSSVPSDPHRGPPLLGLFMARGPPVRDLVPALHLLSEGGIPHGLYHIPVFAVAEASPMPVQAYAPNIMMARGMPRPAPGQTGGPQVLRQGPVPPALAKDLMARMISSCHIRNQSNVAGLLMQLRATKAAPFACDEHGKPAPIQGVPVVPPSDQPPQLPQMPQMPPQMPQLAPPMMQMPQLA